MKYHRLRWFVVGATSWVFAQACTAPGGPDKIKVGFSPPDAAASADGNVVAMTGELKCDPLQSSQPYPPRSSVTAGHVSTVAPLYVTDDLFARFKTVCGGCHVDASLGNFVVGRGDFRAKVTRKVLDTITTTDPAVLYMPPASAGYPPYASRVATDSVVQLVALLNLWLQQDSPDTGFQLPQADQGAATNYALTSELGAKMTNIGTCVPGKRMVGSDVAPMDELDAFFAQATELPPTLDKTDLVTLDSEELAKRDVISFAPAYPLWTENAGKMRYVRVPRGQTIAFDEATQQFHIPPNTRFYKTFLKEVIDVDGHPGWRKLETRVIVSRPDVNGPDGRAQAQTALYGTYLWSDDESTATLLTDPLRDGKPFVDRIITYVTDEAKAKAIADTKPRDLQRALKDAGLTRHYAFPGALRCVACHMGSPNQSFILGFTPLQLARRPTGVGGLYEAAMGDELTQVQRLIDYGVISGLTPDDILPLEVSEGTRAARTPEELNAQAYMVGNCAHCHNPRGFPTVNQPLLADKLNFLPSQTGGIFQFPLDRTSPVRHRGLLQDTPIPYITPSLYDLPVDELASKAFCPDGQDAVIHNGDCWSPGANGAPHWILAPWRSLVYRNVEAPFDYFEDFVPFAHMPLHSPGFDCRAPRIIGDWMVSIPAELVDTTTREDAYRGRNLQYFNANRDVQPYREVTPDSPNYAKAVAVARERLDKYHAGPRYNFCPAPYTADIVDSLIQEEVDNHAPVTSDTGGFTDPMDPTLLTMPYLQVPIRPNYISFDDTDVPGPWFPRNPLWNPGIVDPTQISEVVHQTITQPTDTQGIADLTRVLEELQTIQITDDLRNQLLKENPAGLWDASKPACDFSGIPKVGDFTGTERPDWMDLAKAPAMAAVFMETPGAAVFTTICYNCHGVKADSKGLLANAITNLTGGDGRVANFRDGLFGPVSDPGANRTRVFKEFADKLKVTPDDLAVRYVAYMALGGTQKHLPQDVLREVAQAPVFGALRKNLSILGSADMLQVGLALCNQIARTELPAVELRDGRLKWSEHTGLIDTSGDADMWLKLCSLNNRPLVHVISPNAGDWDANSEAFDLRTGSHSLYWGDGKGPDGKPAYPSDAPVMDHRGRLHQGLTADNPFPICALKPDDPTLLRHSDAVLTSISIVSSGAVIPYCPSGLVTPVNRLNAGPDTAPTFPDAQRWAARGTINAAMAVFLYLDQIERDPTKRKPLYNQCDQLAAGK
jgi:mono/diheme cytochrome c family protein